MKKVWITILIIGVIFCTAKSCKKNNTSSEVITVYSQTIQHTPKWGTTVASLSGVSENILNDIDEAMTKLRDDIEAEGKYPGINTNPSIYTIYALHTCTLSPEARIPAFKVRADNYDGSEYDQDPRPGIGYVFAAEYVIKDLVGPAQWRVSDEYIICSQGDGQDVEDSYVKNVARYGLEHIFLSRVDFPRYLATETHSGGNGHPIIPETNAAKSLFSSKVDFVGLSGAAKGRVKR